MKGRVKWFDDKRGYGFITGDDGRDTYVHYSHIQVEGFRSLKHNQQVAYDIVATDDGKEEARNVVIIPTRR